MQNTFQIIKSQSKKGEARKKLAKTFFPRNESIHSEPYDNATFFDYEKHNVKDIKGLYSLLQKLNGDSYSAIIRGTLKDGMSEKGQYRRKGGDGAAVIDTDRSWVCIDIDDYRLKTPCDPSNAEALRNAAREVVANNLPSELRSISFVAQWSNSAFLDKQTGGVDPTLAKIHLWYLLDKPVCSAGLKKTLREWEIKDTSTADPIQVHYTSAPTFSGMQSPIPRDNRVLLVKNDEEILPISFYKTWDLEEYQQVAERLEQERLDRKKDSEEAYAQWCRDNQADASTAKTMREISENILQKAVQKIYHAQPTERGKVIFSQSKWISRIANEPRNQLNASYAHDMLENAALSIQENVRDARKSVENGWTEGATDTHLLTPPIDKQKKSKKQKKKDKAALESTSVQNIYERYANLSASQQRKQYPSTPDYLKEIPVFEGLTAVCSSLGTGKTQAAKDLCKKHGTVLWLAHRVALTRNTQERLNNSTMDAFTLYLDKEGNLVENRLIVCVDSIARVTRTHDLVVIDEADQVLRSIVKKSKNQGALDAIIHKVILVSKALSAAKQIVLLSADLDEPTIKAFKRMGNVKHVTRIDHDWSHPDACYNFYDSIGHWRQSINDALVADKRIFLFCAAKGQAETIHYWAKEQFPDKRYVCIHREAEDFDKETLDNVNESWSNADMVIVTTSAGSGVSFDVPDHFDKVFINGIHAPMDFPASEYLQGAMRIRHPKDRTVDVYIPDSERPFRSREQLRAEMEKREAYTLRMLSSIAQADTLRGFEDSTAQMVDQVWLDAAEQSELRSHYGLKWVLDTLLERNIRITYTVGEGDPSKGENIKMELKEAKLAAKMESWIRVSHADDLCPDEAEGMRGKELKKEDQLKLKKHDVAMFYSDHEDAFNQPTAPSISLIAEDRDGHLRKCIRNLAKATTYAKDKDYLLHLDMLDLQHDVSEEEVKIYRKRRSKYDAKHHLAEAKQLYIALRIVGAEHPEFEEAVAKWASVEFKKHDYSADDLITMYNQDVKRHGKFTNCRIGKDMDYQSSISAACSMFGIKRIASRKFKQARTYSMDMEQLQTILNLGSFEQARTDRALNEYKVVGTVIDVPVQKVINLDGLQIPFGFDVDTSKAKPVVAQYKGASEEQKAILDDATIFKIGSVMHYYEAMKYGNDFDTTQVIKGSIPEVDYKLAMWCKKQYRKQVSARI